MEYRKLRIAWSVAWGILCLLLIVLWVRSYWVWEDLLYSKDTPRPPKVELSTRIGSRKGTIYLWHSTMDNLAEVGGEALSWQVNGSDDIAPYPSTGFQWHRSNPNGRRSADHDTFICVPHWSLILLATMLGAAPWISWSKRFSLRTLLVAVALLAVGLGLAVYALR
jgi:hypothetical protein